MILRICLIVAILAGLGAGGIAYYESTTQIPQLTGQRDNEKNLKDTEITAHNKTKGELKKTQGVLAQTQQELADTKSERDKAVARAEAEAKQAEDLTAKLTKTTADLKDANDTVTAYKSSGLSPDEVVKLNSNLQDANKKIAAINGEKLLLQRQLTVAKAELNKFIDPDSFVKLPSSLKGTIVAVDPKWDFVVINVGGDDGVLKEGEMLVSRQGRLVGKVIIRTVEKARCIANIVPGWSLGEMIEGDVVTPAHPASS
jgi:hypothetical protein